MNYMHISALPGQPSTFWQGESGRWYTSKLAAENDYVDNAVDPQAYVAPKSFWHEHRFAIIAVLVVVALALAGYTAWKFKAKLFPKLPI